MKEAGDRLILSGATLDLVAVGGNPVERVEALADIRLVIANGKTNVNRLVERRPS